MAKFLVKTSSDSGIQGPFSGQELEQLARTAELQPQYLVSKDGGTSWQDAIRFFSNDLEADIETARERPLQRVIDVQVRTCQEIPG